MRVLASGLGLCLLALLALTTGPAAWAEDEAPARRVLVVIDRGSSAKGSARTDSNNALRIWSSLAQHGLDCRLVAAGVNGDGTTLIDAVSPTKAGLAGLGRRAVFDFAGPTDPRAVLAYALGSEEGNETAEGAVDIVLLGNFGPTSKESAESLGEVVSRWNKAAPEGSRVLAVRTQAGALKLLEDARGLVAGGRLVVGFGEPLVETQPFSPFALTPEGIEARVRVLADVLTLTRKAPHGPILSVTSDVRGDTLLLDATAGLHTLVVRRRPQDGRTATLTFARDESAENVHWLIDPPGPLTFRWDALAQEARLVTTDGSPAPAFTAIDVDAGTLKRVTLRLLRTRTGPAPAWQLSGKDGPLPTGLTVDVGPEVRTSHEVGESEVRLAFAALAGKPLEARGTLVLTAEGLKAPIELAYEIRVRAGHAVLEAEPVVAALPHAASDKRSLLRLVAKNANVPAALQLVATCDGGQERWLRAILTTPSGGAVTRWKLTEPLVLELGDERAVSFELDAEAPAELLWPCVVAIKVVPLAGIKVEGGALLTVRKRRPRIKLGGPPPTFLLKDGTLRSHAPLVLQLDADGGEGDWLLGLTQTAPTLRSRTGKIGWQAVTRGAGVWHIVPTGEWEGPQPGIFRDQEDHVALEIAWEPGRDPGVINVPVEIPARWGERGFIILTLALMALLLVLLVSVYMRTPPVKGTLLYTVDGLDGTVGRLDLAAVGRKTRVIASDANGKLSVANRGESIAKVRPTRVGGMLEYVDVSGSKERRLLVDGVSLRLGRHIIRYVYGRPTQDELPPTPPPGEDLLGEEFDIASGRIQALEDESPS